MRRVVILGAGRSAPFLIRRLVDLAPEREWQVVVADQDQELARRRIGDAPHATAVAVDATEEPELARLVEGADVVATFLAPRFQAAVARHCIETGAHMVSVSYLSRETQELDHWARERGVLLLGEMGLDPGIDHMMAAEAVGRVQRAGGVIRSFRSFGSGVPAPSPRHNPLRYLVTWNPWNVAVAGRAGAQYLLDGQIRIVPHSRLFLHTWPVEVDGVGTLEAYPNRDSLGYMEHFGLNGVHTMIRGTLRWPGFCEAWAKIVRIGLSNDNVVIPDLASRSPREVVGMFLPIPVPPDRVEAATTLFLELNPTSRVMACLRFLGLFDEAPCDCPGDTAADMLSHLLQRKLAPVEGEHDMVTLVHEMEVEHGDGSGTERLVSTMVDTGEACEMSAMARTVGLPAALALEKILAGELRLTGCQLPIRPEVYEPVLRDLEAAGLSFSERTEPVG